MKQTSGDTGAEPNGPEIENATSPFTAEALVCVFLALVVLVVSALAAVLVWSWAG